MGANDGQEELPEAADLGAMVSGVVWMMAGVSAGVIGLRFWCKLSRGRGLWIDDYWLVAAWVSLTLLAGFNTASVAYDFGKHGWQVDWTQAKLLLLYMNLGGTFSIIACAWSKTSFAFTLLRICDKRWQRYLVWFLIISLNISLGVAVLITWIQCWPVARVYDEANNPGTCWPKYIQKNYNISVTAYSGFMDIVLALLPWSILWKVKMTMKEKLGVMTAMSMGVFAGIISFLKIPSLSGIAGTDLIDTVPLVIWGAAESAVTILAASIPVLRLLLPRRNRHVNELDYKSGASSNSASRKLKDRDSAPGNYELLGSGKAVSPVHFNFSKKRDSISVVTPYRGEDIDSIQDGLNGAMALQRSMRETSEGQYAPRDRDLPSPPARLSHAYARNPNSIPR